MRHALDSFGRLDHPSARHYRWCPVGRVWPPSARRWRNGAWAAGLGGLMACAGSTVPPPVAGEASRVERRSAPFDSIELAREADWSYRVPARCPSEARFFDHIARRVPRLAPGDVRLALGPSIAVDVTASATADSATADSGSDWRGRVSFHGADGPVSREVTGDNCEEVVFALALITSLWLRPDDDARAVGASPAASSPATAGPALDGPSIAGAPAGGGRLAVQPRLSPSSSQPELAPQTDGDLEARRSAGSGPLHVARSLASDARRERSAVEPTADSERASDTGSAKAPAEGSDEPSGHRIQIAGMIGFASEPSGALSGRLQVERWGAAHVSSWSSALALAYAVGRHENDRLGSATLSLLHGQLELCPPGLEVAGSTWLRACAHGRAGALHFSAATDRVPDTRSLWRPWAALGGGLHAGIPVSASVSLRLLAEVSVVLVRDEFATERPSTAATSSPPDVFTFYEISPVSFDLGLGAAHAF